MSPAGTEGPLETPRFEELLTTLEKTIADLAGGAAPLEELVAAHQRAVRLLAEAQSRLEELRARADQIARSLKSPTKEPHELGGFAVSSRGPRDPEASP